MHHRLRWQLVPFADAGTVWGVNLEDPALVGSGAAGGADGAGASGRQSSTSALRPGFPVHPTGGLGVRAIWATTLVGRFDVAVGQEVVPDGSGGGGYGTSLGFYLAFDHRY